MDWEGRVYIRYLGIDDGNQRGVNVRKRGGLSLRLDTGLGKQAPTANNVLLEKLQYHFLDVGDIDFVNESVYALLERFPCEALVGEAVNVRDG